MSKKIIRIDIETAPLYPSEEAVPEDVMNVWKERYREGKAEDQTPWEFFREKSALYPEFSRIVCVSMGYEKMKKIDTTTTDGDSLQWVEVEENNKEEKSIFTTKSFFGYDEKALLGEVAEMLSVLDKDHYTLGGHNINGFDLWFLRKRMVITGVCTMNTFPPILDTLSKKPRELDTIDTMQLFKMWKDTATSLAVMCLSLGVSSPKDDMDWIAVKSVFYSKVSKNVDNPLDRIVQYCEWDIYATYSCYCRVNGLEILPMDGHKPFIDEKCKKEFNWHSEDSVPLWAFRRLTGIEKPYLSPSDSKLFKDFLDRYTQRNKERNEIILSRNSIHKW